MHDRHVDPEALRRLAAERDLTLIDLAAASGVSYTHIKLAGCVTKSGKQRDLSYRLALRVAVVLRTPIESFTLAAAESPVSEKADSANRARAA